MEAGKKTINDIFNGNRILKVPFFQRSYVWEEQQWERFLQDMELATSRENPYFLGSIILKQLATDTGRGVSDIRTVVDGQQRLTTLNIFFKVLYLKTSENAKFNRVFRIVDNEEIALKHNHNDISDFNEIVSSEKDIEIAGKSNIVKAYNYFRGNIDLEKLDPQKLLAKIMFVGVDLRVDEDEQSIFDTINSLGVRLTTAELLKNHFFRRIEDIDSYKKNWKETFEKDTETKDFWDKEITTGRVKRNNIDLFFYSFLQIKLQDNSLKVKADDKKNLSKVEGLFDSYKRFIAKYLTSKDKLIQEIKEYAILYRKSIDFDVLEEDLPAEYGIERINAIIFGLDNTTLIPYVLYVLRNTPSEQKDIFMYLESYILRRIVVHASSKNYNNLFSEELISNKILSKAELKELIEKKSDKANYMPSDAELEKGFMESKLTNKHSSGVIYLIESRIRNRKSQSTALLGLNRYSLEHVMPKKWENYWDEVGTEQGRLERDRLLLTLGNLTIITSSLNTSIRDANWKDKKKGKKDKEGLNKYASGIETFSEFLEKSEWSENVIIERAKFLFQEATTVWKL